MQTIQWENSQMAEFKGTSIIFIRTYFRKEGPEIEKKFLSLLTPEETTVYQTCLAFSWIPIGVMAKIFKKAASIIYGSDPDGMSKLSSQSASHDLKGTYKVLLHFINIPTVVNQAAALWKTYCNAGQAHAQKDPEKNKVHFILENFPDLPEECFETIRGYIQGTVAHTGARNITVQCDKSNSKAWKWTVAWL
jgi:hypothetical protein